MGMTGDPCRYRETLMKNSPKFGGVKNQFRTTAVPSKQRADSESAAEAPSPATPDGSGPAPEQREKHLERRDEFPAPVCLADAVPAPGKLSRIASLFSAPPRNRAKALQPVQAELALDRVKVVRNDLKDGENEVFLVEARAARSRPPAETSKAPTGDKPAARAVKELSGVAKR